MNEQQLDIVVEILEETFGIETTTEKAKEFIGTLDCTRENFDFVDTRESKIETVVAEKPDLSVCCEKLIESRKLSGSLGHYGYHCTGCGKARNV